MLRKTLGALAMVAMMAVPAFAAPKVLCRNGAIVRKDVARPCRGNGGIAAVQPPHRRWYQFRSPLARCRDGSTDRGRKSVCLNHGGVARFL